MHKFYGIGKLTTDPKVSETKVGYVTKLRVSFVNNKKLWLTLAVTCFGKQGEAVAKYTSKGSKVYIEGYLTEREWINAKGVKRKEYDLVAEKVDFLSRVEDGDEEELEPPEEDAVNLIPIEDDDLPF
jgi:single-stranded DNA-binding protein